MLEHNRVMNASNEDWIHVTRFIQSALPKDRLMTGLAKSIG